MTHPLPNLDRTSSEPVTATSRRAVSFNPRAIITGALLSDTWLGFSLREDFDRGASLIRAIRLFECQPESRAYQS